MPLTSVFYDGPVTETDRAKNLAGGSEYGVYGPEDFKVTTHPSIANAVIVKAGRAHGHGVTDTAAIDQIVNCTPLSVGQSRWDLVVVRRNWQPTLGGPSTLEVMHAGGTPTIPAQRKVGPGVEDDQPLAFIKWQGGTSAPVEFIDLRVHAGNGGLFAKSDLVRTYLTTVGTHVNINGVIWALQLGLNDIAGWVKVADANPAGTTYTPSWAGAQSWGSNPTAKGYYWRNGNHVRVQAMIQAGSSPSLGLGAISFSLPPGLPVGSDFMATGAGVWNSAGTSGNIRPVITAAGPGLTTASVWATPGTNEVSTPGAAGWPWGQGNAFHVWIEYKTDAA